MTTQNDSRDRTNQRTPQKTRRVHRLRVPVTPTERARIAWGAEAAQLPVASYLRQLGLCQRPRASCDRRRIHRILCIGGDLGRFGGLVKLWLTDNPKLDLFDRGAVRELLSCVQAAEHDVLQFAERAMAASGTNAVPAGEPFVAETDPPPRERHLFVPVTPEEAASIQKRAAGKQLSVAGYLRERGLHYRPLSAVSEAQVEALQVSSDGLAKLGGLLKRWLVDDPRLRGFPPDKAREGVGLIMRRARGYLADLREAAKRDR